MENTVDAKGDFVTCQIDHTKKSVILNDAILALNRRFLDSVADKLPSESDQCVKVCTLTPDRETIVPGSAMLVWDETFRTRDDVKETKFVNELQSIMMYGNELHLSPVIAFAALECIRQHIKPRYVFMTDGEIQGQCQILFNTII